MKPRLERLESLRAIACIVVFTYHAYLSHNAYWSINVFFTLTAFLMTYNGLGKLERYPSGLIGCARFAWGKVKRLYPLYFISLLILILRIILLAPENPPVEQLIIFAKQFVLCALLIQSWPPETSWAFAFNVVGWYISTSLFLYFCFPALLRRISKIKIPYFMITKPDFNYSESDTARRAVIMQSYVDAWESGDRNVYFIDGSAFGNGMDISDYTIDTTHPTDDGFRKMADYIGDVIAKTMNLG